MDKIINKLKIIEGILIFLTNYIKGNKCKLTDRGSENAFRLL